MNTCTHTIVRTHNTARVTLPYVPGWTPAAPREASISSTSTQGQAVPSLYASTSRRPSTTPRRSAYEASDDVRVEANFTQYCSCDRFPATLRYPHPSELRETMIARTNLDAVRALADRLGNDR